MNTSALAQMKRRLNVLCYLQRQAPLPRRYATITISTLNGGHGKAYRNFKTDDDFEMFWKSMRYSFPCPSTGCGAIGDGMFNVSYHIYDRLLTEQDYHIYGRYRSSL